MAGEREKSTLKLVFLRGRIVTVETMGTEAMKAWDAMRLGMPVVAALNHPAGGPLRPPPSPPQTDEGAACPRPHHLLIEGEACPTCRARRTP